MDQCYHMNCGKAKRRFTILVPALFASLMAVSGPKAGDDGSGSLPPVSEVLKRIVERSQKDAENDRRFDASYSYRRVKTREVRTAKGKLRQREVTSRSHEVRHSVAGTSSAKSTDDTDGHRAEEEAPELKEDSNKLRSHGDYGKRDIPINDDLLGRFDFNLTGRDTVNGRSTLILDFKPAARELPVKSFLDRFINRMAGRLWVDEADGVIVQGELRLTETVSFIAGIAGAVYELDCRFKRTRMDDGLWYMPEFSWTVDWRELWSRKVVSVQEKKDDVRPANPSNPISKSSSARIELP